MASACISSCVNDARIPVRATYVNLYKWPESDKEFVRAVSSATHRGGAAYHGHPRVVDSISCRQLYLKSYTFSREEDYKEEKKAMNCLGRTKEKEKEMDNHRKKRKARGGDHGGRRGSSAGKRKCAGFRKAKEASCSALGTVFRRLLSCTTKIDVVN